MKDWLISFTACLAGLTFLLIYLECRMKLFSDKLSDFFKSNPDVNRGINTTVELNDNRATVEPNNNRTTVEPNNIDEIVKPVDDEPDDTDDDEPDDTDDEPVNTDDEPDDTDGDDDLLNNKPWVRLMENVFSLQDNINSVANQEELPQQTKKILDYLNAKFEELYKDNSLTPIQDETTFDWERHQPIDSQSPQSGDKIESTVIPGWRYNDRIFKLATVTTSNNSERNDG